MIVGDVHLPFEHANYLKFLKDQRDKEQPDKIVFIGDFIDHYALSRFSLDPDVQGQRPEFIEALRHARKYYDAFPEAIWIIGNHDRRPYRKALEVGLGRTFLKDLMDVYECPSGWEVLDSTEIEGVYYFHGEAVGGQSSWQNYARDIGQSCVAGHLHSIAGTRYHQLPSGKQVFMLETGSGVDDTKYAFAYGKNSSRKSVLSCGFVEDGVQAKAVLMDLTDRRYRRIR